MFVNSETNFPSFPQQQKRVTELKKVTVSVVPGELHFKSRKYGRHSHDNYLYVGKTLLLSNCVLCVCVCVCVWLTLCLVLP